MTRLEAALILFFILFIFFFALEYLCFNRKQLPKYNRKKKKKRELAIEVSYLSHKFKIEKEKLLTNKNMLIISLINAFIISFTSIVVIYINVNIIFQFVIGFVLLILLIYAMYEIYGRVLERREKNGI